VSAVLPPPFADLEKFVPHWAAPDTAARGAARDRAGPEGCAAFLAAGLPHVAPALDYLDDKGFAGFDAADERLMSLMLGLAHAALGAEIQGSYEVRHSVDRPAMRIFRSPADSPPAA